MILRMPKPPSSIKIHAVQHGAGKPLKAQQLKTDDFEPYPRTALGAGGRAFKSPRPDQLIQSDTAILEMAVNLSGD
jgi:hypothetical protein